MNLKQNIVIVDYGVGNTQSVSNAIKFLGYTRVKISNEEITIQNADALILPGVGAFEEAINNLKDHNLDKTLNELVLIKKKPILGICVGMQMLASYSYENGVHNGLNWIPGSVIKLETDESLTIPHVGWNDVKFNKAAPLFTLNSNPSNFYFDHSFWYKCDDEANIAATVDYGREITAAVQKDNIYGVQFHPEKSHISGFKFFRSFLNSV